MVVFIVIGKIKQWIYSNMEKITPKINSKISEHLQLYQDYINDDYNQFLNSILNNSDTFVKTRLISNNQRRGRIEYIVFNFRNIEIQIPIFLITNSLLFLSGQNYDRQYPLNRNRIF